MKNDEQKYTLTVTESQLRLIADCVEDMSRFMGGQMELWNATSRLDNFVELKERLNDLHSLVTPDLPRNASYGWNGGGCPNKNQEEFIAKTYAIYREIRHRLRVLNKDLNDENYNVYDSPSLTCELGGELPKIEKV